MWRDKSYLSDKNFKITSHFFFFFKFQSISSTSLYIFWYIDWRGSTTFFCEKVPTYVCRETISLGDFNFNFNFRKSVHKICVVPLSTYDFRFYRIKVEIFSKLISHLSCARFPLLNSRVANYSRRARKNRQDYCRQGRHGNHTAKRSIWTYVSRRNRVE